MIKVGGKAPDFLLEGIKDGKFKKFSLKNYKNKWLVIFFYPLDFVFVCPTEIREFSKHIKDFRGVKTEIVGVSVDSIHSHKAWIEGTLGPIHYPLLSDFHKKMSEDYDVLLEDEGVALRGTFIVDPKGVVRHITISDNDVGRSVKETLRVVRALQTGSLCPIEWKPGQKTLS